MDGTLTDPFADGAGSDVEDHRLIAAAVAGDRKALGVLVTRHQPWIYNIAFRMVLTPEDAEDVTQEILIKMITKLSSFNPSKAAFRTWLYRVVANHVINMKKRGYETGVTSFENYYSAIQNVPDEHPDASPETQGVVSDIMIGCVLGALLCLDRRQRLVFILAVVFGVSGSQGSEILGISKVSFRKILSRARTQLHSYMYGNCGMVNKDAPCRCHKKAEGFIREGWHSPDRIIYAQSDSPAIRDVILRKMDQFTTSIYSRYVRLFRDHPFYRAPDVTRWYRNLIESTEFKQILQLE